MSKALESKAFPNAYLRIDGTGVSAPNTREGGTDNCAYGVGAGEKFYKRPKPEGTVAFEPAAFPGVYLGMDAQDIGEFGLPSSDGTVNCQLALDHGRNSSALTLVGAGKSAHVTRPGDTRG